MKKIGQPLRRMDFEKIINKREPEYFTAQTPNGTAKWSGTGWNRAYDWERPQLEPKPTWPAGRSNRTAE